MSGVADNGFPVIDLGLDMTEVERLERKFRRMWCRIDCPACGHDRGVTVAFGYSGDPDALKASQLGIVRLGGCVINDDDPQVVCAACDEPITWVFRP